MMGTRRSMPPRGFTLIEAMVVVAVLGVVAALAAPSFVSYSATNRLRGATNEAYSDLQFARSEAVQRNAQMSITFSATGYFVAPAGATAASAIKSVTLANGNAVSSGAAMVATFDPVRATAAVTNGPLELANSGAPGKSMRVTVSAMGRAAVCSPGGTVKGVAAC